MPAVSRVLRILSIVWALAAVLGMSQAIAPSVDGHSMFATWTRAFAWLLGFASDTAADAAGMRLLALKSVGQIVFFFGWIPALLLTKPRGDDAGTGLPRGR